MVPAEASYHGKLWLHREAASEEYRPIPIEGFEYEDRDLKLDFVFSGSQCIEKSN